MDIARSSSYSQRLTGPVMVVPYRKTVREWKLNEKLNKRYEETREVRGRLYFLPERFELDGRVQTELRARGIYQARLFHADNRISGRFVLPEQWGIKENFADYRFEPAFLAVGISDIRGIENALKLELGSQRLEFAPGTHVEWLGEGVHVALPEQDSKTPAALDFAFDLRLQGTEQLQVVPVGKTSQVTLGLQLAAPELHRQLPAGATGSHRQGLQRQLADLILLHQPRRSPARLPGRTRL